MVSRNLITDIPGLRVGHAGDAKLGSGVTVVVFDAAVVASVDVRGGGPGTRETALLDPAQTVEGIDAIVLSGGSAFGLDAASGVQAWLREQGRGFPVRDARVPIVPGAILFDLLSGGDKNWGRYPPYRELGYEAAETAGADFALGSVGAGLGATTVNLKGGIGSASARDARRHHASARSWPSTRSAASPSATARISGRRRSSRTRNSAGAAGRRILRRCAGAAQQGRPAPEHHARHRRHRRQPDQGAGQAARGDGADRARARDLSGAHPARRRHRVRGRDRRKAAARSVYSAERAWHGGRQCARPRRRARRLRGDRAALRRRLPSWQDKFKG